MKRAAKPPGALPENLQENFEVEIEKPPVAPSMRFIFAQDRAGQSN